MEMFKTMASGAALLLCLTQNLPGEVLASCGCDADRNATAPYIEDMRWLTHGHVPAQTREVGPLICQLDSRDSE